MALTNLIVNGTFTDSTNTSAADWTGTDIETRASSVYVSGTSSTNRVAELNGGTSAVTVMEQTFTVDDAGTAEFNVDYALRDTGTLGDDGFTVEILDSDNNVIFTQEIIPTVKSTYVTYTASVTFDTAGDYTIRFTEIGDNADGSGTVIDNVEVLICFGGETRIETPSGFTLARDLKVGQLVETENGPKPIRWIGKRTVGAEQTSRDARFFPVRICQGALGCGLPTRDLLVSRQHRFKATSPIAKRMFGEPDVLLSAIKLTRLAGIYIDTSVSEIEYVHVLLDDHEVVFAEGAPAETLLLGDQAKKALGDPQIEEINLIFPGLLSESGACPPAYHIPPLKKQNELVERVAKNKRSVLELMEAV